MTIDFASSCFELARHHPSERPKHPRFEVSCYPFRRGDQLPGFIDSATASKCKAASGEVVAFHSGVRHSRLSGLESLDCPLRSTPTQVYAGSQNYCVNLNVDVALLSRETMRASKRPKGLFEVPQSEICDGPHLERMW